MPTQSEKVKVVAFLRGINVGGHHKVPMADLRKELTKLGYENILTILNSGNVIFDAKIDKLDNIERKIAHHLENYFDFSIPVIIRKFHTIKGFLQDNPFIDFELTKDLRGYVSFLKNNRSSDLPLPWTSADKSFKIVEKRDNNIFSVLDLSISKTPEAMNVLAKQYGKDITTRNWNTIERINKKVNSSNPGT